MPPVDNVSVERGLPVERGQGEGPFVADPQVPPVVPPPPPPPPAALFVPGQRTGPEMPRPGAPSTPRPAGPPIRRARTPRWGIVAAIVAGVIVVAGAALQTRPALVPVVTLHSPAAVTDPSIGWAPEFVDQHGRPARWDPCRPVHYVVNAGAAPPGGLADLRRALATVSSATGITFVDDGSTTEIPTPNRSAYQPDRYGKRWAPLLIAWVSRSRTSLIDEADAEGVTVPIAVPTSQGGVLVSAEVALNTDQQLPVGFRTNGPSEGEVLLHELGHAMGLAHVANRADAMFPTVRGIAAYGDGDLAGLAALGRGAGCLPEPRPRHISVEPHSGS